MADEPAPKQSRSKLCGVFTCLSDTLSEWTDWKTREKHYGTIFAIALFSIFFVATDILVMKKADGMTMAYLTNQVWVMGMAVRLSMVVAWFFNSSAHRPNLHMALSIGWGVIGAAYFAVMITFFTLVAMDYSILDVATEKEHKPVALVIEWNHLRHVSPVILHILITFSCSRWYARGLEAVNDVKRCEGAAILRAVFYGTPLLLALLHSLCTDDKELYQYTRDITGIYCQLIFAGTSLAASAWLYYVPGREHSTGPSKSMYVIAEEPDDVASPLTDIA